MSDAWKQFERRVAKYFGTVRNALSGGNSKVTRSDSLHKNLFVSCKLSSRGWGFESLYKEEKPKADAENKTVVLALQRKNHKGFYLACHSDDFPKIAKEYLEAHGYHINKPSKHS